MKNMMGNMNGQADRGQLDAKFELLCDAHQALDERIGDKRQLEKEFRLRLIAPSAFLKEMTAINKDIRAIQAEMSKLGGGR
jgi:hypothetical protein